MPKNPPFTNLGLDAAQAYLVAYRLAVTNALADYVVEDILNEEEAQVFLEQVANDTASLMLGEDVDVNDAGVVMAINPENYIFVNVANNLADEIDAIAEKMEVENVASY